MYLLCALHIYMFVFFNVNDIPEEWFDSINMATIDSQLIQYIHEYDHPHLL